MSLETWQAWKKKWHTVRVISFVFWMDRTFLFFTSKCIEQKSQNKKKVHVTSWILVLSLEYYQQNFLVRLDAQPGPLSRIHNWHRSLYVISTHNTSCILHCYATVEFYLINQAQEMKNQKSSHGETSFFFGLSIIYWPPIHVFRWVTCSFVSL